jgi:hypothetical protein
MLLSGNDAKKDREIIKVYKDHIGKNAKVYNVPGITGMCMEKRVEEPIKHTM